MPKIVWLWTDVSIWLLLAAVVGYAVSVLRKPELAAKWGLVFRDPADRKSVV